MKPLALVCSFIIVLEALNATDATSQSLMRLETLLQRAENHPQILMLAASERAAESRIPMRSNLMDPMLFVGIQNLPTTFSFSDDPMTAKVVGISQSFKFPGKLSSERTIGEADVNLAKLITNGKRNFIRYSTKEAYYRYVKAVSSQARSVEIIGRLDQMSMLVHPRIAVGEASVVELLRLEIEVGKMRAMIADDEGMKRMALSIVKSYARVEDLDSIAPAPQSIIKHSLAELLALASQHNPVLRAFRIRDEQLANQGIRANLERYPDFDVMLMYMQRDKLKVPDAMTGAVSTKQHDMLGLQISINLPFNYGGKTDAGVAEVEAMKWMNADDEAAMKLEIEAMIREAISSISASEERIRILDNIIVHAVNQTTEIATLNLAARSGDLRTMLSNEIERAGLLRARDAAGFEREQAIAKLEYVVGVQLSN